MAVPKNNDYLGSSIATLKKIHASTNIQPLDPGLITADIAWSSQATLFSPCACLDPDREVLQHHHDPVQMLLPEGRNLHLDIPNTCLSITLGSIECNGAVVFGHTPYRWPWPKNKATDGHVDSESTEPPPSASNSNQPRVGRSDKSGVFEIASLSSHANKTTESQVDNESTEPPLSASSSSQPKFGISDKSAVFEMSSLSSHANKTTDSQVDSESSEPPLSASNSTQPRVGRSDKSGVFEMPSSSSRAQTTSASRPVTLEDPAKAKVEGKWSWFKKFSR
jgi:hypothetical protein